MGALAICEARDAAVPVGDDAICIIHNPAAGPRRNFDLAAIIRASGRRLPVRCTTAPGEAEHMAAQAAAAGFRIVVAAGGDGTVNEVARGLLGSDAALAILPLGSGNGLARHMGMPMQADRALGAIRHVAHSRIDVGRINGRPFFCTAGIGFDAHVARHFATAQQRGLATYLRTVLARYRGYRATLIEAAIDGRDVAASCFVMAFANASQYGNNAFIAPHAELSDGVLDVCLLNDLPPWRAARAGLALMAGNLPVREAGAYHTGAEIAVECHRPMEFHVDGEFAGEADRFLVSLSAGELAVALPISGG